MICFVNNRKLPTEESNLVFMHTGHRIFYFRRAKLKICSSKQLPEMRLVLALLLSCLPRPDARIPAPHPVSWSTNHSSSFHEEVAARKERAAVQQVIGDDSFTLARSVSCF